MPRYGLYEGSELKAAGSKKHVQLYFKKGRTIKKLPKTPNYLKQIEKNLRKR